MSYKEKQKLKEGNSKNCVQIAKELLSIGDKQKAEKVLVTALSVFYDDEAQSLLDEIKNETFEINEKRKQKQRELKDKKQLEDAQYAEMNTNRFKMRAKVLSLEVSVILRKYENDAKLANTTMTPVGDAVENLLVKVDNSLNKADFGEAEKYLREAEKIYDDAYAKIPKNEKGKNNNDTPIVKELVIPKHTPGAREKAELKGNEGDENRCIRIAEAAIKDEDFAKAEKFLLKAERLRPTTVAKKLLLVVRDMASKKESAATGNADKSSQDDPCKLASDEPAASNITGEDNQKMADKITKIAETSFKEGNYERAKSMLDKAEQIFPTTAAKDLLQKIHEIKAEKEAFDTLSSMVKIVFKWMSELKPIDYNIAEKIILDLKRNIPNVDVAEILSEIRAVRASRSSATEIISDTKADVYYKNKQISEICLNIAKYYVKANDVYGAKELLRLALSFKANESVKSLLNEVLEKYPGEICLQQKEEINTMKWVEAQNLILSAQKAFTKGDLETSEQLLLIAKELHPQEQIEAILRDIYAAKDALSNLKSQGRSGTPGRCEPPTTNEELSDANTVPLYSAAVKKTKESGESSQRIGVHRTRDSFIDNPEHKSASHQSYKNEYSPSPDANAHPVYAVPAIKVEADIYFEMAKQAFTKQQYDKAEHFILKVLDMSPSNEANALLEDIQAARREYGTKKYKYSENKAYYYEKTVAHAPSLDDFETIENDKRVEAEQSIKIAQTALSSGELERAERLLHKAERIFATEQAKQLLKEISLMKSKSDAKDDHNQPSTSQAFKEQIDEVDNLIKMALQYWEKNEFQKAELFLKIANLLCPGVNTADLLHQVQEEVEKKKSKKSKDAKNETRKYMDLAEKALKAGKITEAETLLIVATILCQTKNADESLQKIRQKQTSKSVSNTHNVPTGKNIKVRDPINNLNDFKSDQYLKMAKNAENSHNFLLAEHFFVKAQTLSPTPHAEYFLNDIVREKNKAIEKNKSTFDLSMLKFW